MATGMADARRNDARKPVALRYLCRRKGSARPRRSHHAGRCPTMVKNGARKAPNPGTVKIGKFLFLYRLGGTRERLEARLPRSTTTSVVNRRSASLQLGRSKVVRRARPSLVLVAALRVEPNCRLRCEEGLRPSASGSCRARSSRRRPSSGFPNSRQGDWPMPAQSRLESSEARSHNRTAPPRPTGAARSCRCSVAQHAKSGLLGR